MPRAYLPLLPIPVLAVLVAFSACSSKTDEPASHLIPPAVALAPPPPAAAATPAPTAPTGDNAPSEQELHEFQRPVPK
jgi:hypothetical protein